MRREALTPNYAWDERIGRYRDVESGRLVSSRDVRSALDTVIAGTRNEMMRVAEGLQSGRLSPTEFGAEMKQHLRVLHLASSAAANGGWAQMTPSDFGSVGYRLKEQYQYLDRWIHQLQHGEAALDGRFLVRAGMYAESARHTYEEARRADRILAGETQERRILHGTESCIDCIDYAEMGWQPIGTLPAIGDSQCGGNCRCTFEYRRADEEAHD